MESEKFKYRFEMQAGSLSGLLRALAAAAPPTMDGSPAMPEEIRKLELSVKRAGAGFAVKLKVETPGGASSPLDAGVATVPLPAEEGYRGLKKRMQGVFGRFRRALGDGALPSVPDVERFLADAESMAATPGDCDRYYPAFLETCRRLGVAHREGDLAAFRAQFEALRRQKAACHKACK